MEGHQLSKKEKYLLKKQRKEREQVLRVRRKKIRKTLFISLSILLVAGGIIFLVINLPSKESPNIPGRPEIDINPQEYDAGTISMAAGKIQYTYEIKNKGEGDLKIDRIWTSCMCTTAKLRVGDKTSGEFGMHSNPVFWSQKIAPGGTGFLEVSFDPAFHGPQGVGENIRAVYISTNDPQNEKAEVRLTANVIP